MRQAWHQFIPKLFICLRNQYSLKFFRKDLISGITVGVIALPLAMAIGIASGLTPERGLYTAIVAGFLVSFLGGSRVQIGGPTAAFVAIVYGVVQRQGYEGLVLATLIAGILLIVMAFSRLGTFIKFIPYPLVTGFTTGVALILFSSQIKDFFGLQMGNVPSEFIDKWSAYIEAFPSFDPLTATIALATLVSILIIRRFFPFIPWAIGSLVLITLVCFIFDLPVETIRDRFGEIPNQLPMPGLPDISIDLETIRRLFPDALAIALLAGIESLVSAVIADGMSGDRHKSNCELMAQGVANLGSALFGGIPATAALARTATNIKSGAATPISGIIHALTLFVILLFLTPVVAGIPLAALSAVLIMIAWNMSEIHHFYHLFRAPIGDIVILLSAFLLTIFVDLTAAVEVGLILASFLFMKRMSDLSNVVAVGKFFQEAQEEFPEKNDPDAIAKKEVPPAVEVYEINGPFFFGVADRLKDLLMEIEKPPLVFILRMRKVPIIDASGMHALREFYFQCKKSNTELLLSGVHGQPAKNLKKYRLDHLIGASNIFPHVDAALARARELVQQKTHPSILLNPSSETTD